MVRTLLSLEERRLTDGRARAEEALAFARADFRPDDAAAAESVQALVRLAEGNISEAQQAVARMEPRLKTTQDRLLRLRRRDCRARPSRIQRGPTGSLVPARDRAIGREAAEIGAVATAFDAQLALGEIEIRAADDQAGRARLAALERDATSRGFKSLAAKAAAAAR